MIWYTERNLEYNRNYEFWQYVGVQSFKNVYSSEDPPIMIYEQDLE